MRQYLETTRSPWYSYLFVLPLLVLYQTMAVVANLGRERGVINGADALLQNALQSLGLHGWLGSWLVAAAVVGVIVFRRDAAHSAKPLRRGYFGLMLAESAAYALVFGSVVAFLTSLLLPGGLLLQMGGGRMTWEQKLAASLGAGLYEELVFRLILTGSLIWLFGRLGWKRGTTIASAVLASSVIFSAFHYVGAYGDPFELGSFTFRFVAGVVLAGLFAARGFAVAAWTHALYDVFLVFVGKA